jgi:hypothetical protein
MSLPWWKPDAQLLQTSLGELDEAASEIRRILTRSLAPETQGPPAQLPPEKEATLKGALSSSEGAESQEPEISRMADLLEAAGTLVFLDCEVEARKRLGDLVHSPAAHDLGCAAVSALIEEGLLGRLSGLLDDIYDLSTTEDEERASVEESIVDALAERDRVELALEGLRLLCSREPELADEVLADLAAYDESVRAHLWRTLPLGDRRAAGYAWAAPRYRKRLWWWFLGSDLPHTALEDMHTAARVIHLFPEAREELERMLKAERDLEHLCAMGPSQQDRGKVMSLREYLLRRLRRDIRSDLEERGKVAPAAAFELARITHRLAASGYEEKPLYRGEEVTVSTDGVSLIVDFEAPAEPAPGTPPVLEVPGLLPLYATAALEPARYEFPLSSPHFSASEGWLVVRTRALERRIRLPFEEERLK